MNLDQAVETFIVESRELLGQLESDLLALEQAPEDPELLNAIFRVAHTIKGSAGLFGFDGIVEFTHVMENLLDRLRNRALAATGDLVALLLEAGDHIGALVEIVAVQGKAPDAATVERGRDLLTRLTAHLGQPGDAGQSSAQAVQAVVGKEAGGAGEVERLENAVESDCWHISIRFSPDVLQHGMDPLSFLRYLSTLGELVSVTTLPDALPALGQMDPELCYLGFEIDFRGQVQKSDIEDVFEFVREDSHLQILPPYSMIDDYIRLIREMPENDQRLGEVLVESGAITRHELDVGLARQQAVPEDEKPPIGEVLVKQNSVQQPVVDAALEKQQKARESRLREAHFVRVHADKLDQLINLVGELVIAGASANLHAQRSHDGAMQEASANINRLVEEIRDGALQLRMVPIGETFSKFNRVVRDVSRELQKDISLEISGGDAELDKTVVEKIGDPLMHLVRNAMDHGIEPVDVRQRQGKPAQGRLRLNAYHDSGSIVIEVSDDGGGLNRERILAKALDKQLISYE